MKSPALVESTQKENDFNSEEIHDEFEAAGIDSFFTSYEDEWDEYSIDDFDEF